VVGFVGDVDIDRMNDAIEQLNADVNTTVSSSKLEPGPLLGSLVMFQANMVDFITRWRVWVGEHTGTLSRFADDEFAGFKIEYTQRRKAWENLGQETSAPTMGPGSSPGDLLEKLGDNLNTLFWLGAAGLGFYVFSSLRR